MTIEQITAERDRLRAALESVERIARQDYGPACVARVVDVVKTALASASPAPVESVNQLSLDFQRVSDLAASYCEQRGYKRGPSRKVAYHAFVAGATRTGNPEMVAALRLIQRRERGLLKEVWAAIEYALHCAKAEKA